MECEQSYYIIKTENERLRFLNKNNYHELVNYLAEPQRYFSPTHIDRSTLANTLLPIIFRFNKPNTIQLFYLSNDSLVDIYVVDECGSLFYQQSSFFDDDTLINQFDQFFDSILNRRNLTTPNGVSIPHGIRVEFFQLTKNKIGKYALDKRFSNRGTYPKRYFNIQVIGNVEEGNTVFTIYCDDAEFSSYEYGSELFKKVAQYVVNLRLSGLRYPIHITDIDLSPVLLNENALE